MLEVQLFGTPAIGGLLQNQLNDFHGRSADEWYSIIVKDNMRIALGVSINADYAT
jgi:hypothetical protein